MFGALHPVRGSIVVTRIVHLSRNSRSGHLRWQSHRCMAGGGGGVVGEDVLGESDVGGGTATLVAVGTKLLEDEHAPKVFILAKV